MYITTSSTCINHKKNEEFLGHWQRRVIPTLRAAGGFSSTFFAFEIPHISITFLSFFTVNLSFKKHDA
ncbi:hypothetical protein EON65_48030 [archaeon]|nr:MAG: hypothetical protein EON65_48030 [archaeon]